MAKYAPLLALLQAQPPEKLELHLTFAQIEEVLGRRLPPSARQHRAWWGNDRRQVQGRGWLGISWKTRRVNIQKEEVVFWRSDTPVTVERSNAARQSGETASGVKRLRQFFQSLPPEQSQVALTFEDFGRIRGRDLPQKAQDRRERWANTRNRSWVQVGWEVQSLYRQSRLVVFRRIGTDTAENIRQYLRYVLDGRRPSGPRPTARDLIDWLRLCRRLGWYFEGVVLYEKGGIDLSALDDAEQAELEQDYFSCKRKMAEPPG